MATLFVDKLDPQSGTALEIGTSGDTITIPSGVTITNNGTQTGFGGTNTPFTTVKKDADQTITHNTETKMTFASVVNESASSIFDLTNNKFTVASAGTYLILPTLRIYDSNNHLARTECRMFKNGSVRKVFMHYFDDAGLREVTLGTGFLETLSVNDYIEMYAFVQTNDSGECVAESDNLGTTLGVMKIIT